MIDRRVLRLRKGEDRRIRAGHLWVYSNEIDTAATPLAPIEPGEITELRDSRDEFLGVGYCNPRSLISFRLLTRDRRAIIDSDFLRGRLASAHAFRQRAFPDGPFYRVVYGEADALPGLVVDRYGDYLVVQPGTAGIERMLDAVVDALVEVTGARGVLLRADSVTRQYEGLERYTREAYGSVPEAVEILENGVRFEAPIVGGQKTGWFYDHRVNRDRMRRYVEGARVLDVFSYVGGWGVQAAVAGAREVTCVDSSAAALELVSRNAWLNDVSERISTQVGNAFDVLRELRSRRERFDVVVLDPPAFIKRRKDEREGGKAYDRLNRLGLDLLADGGILISASCSFHFSRESLLRSILKASTDTGRTLQLIEEGHQAPDHPVHPAIPETSYLKTFFVRAL